MLADFGNWLLSVITAVFSALWDFFSDVAVNVLDLVVSAFAALVASIPVPGFLSGGLQGMWSGMDGGVLYVVTQCGVPAALAVVGAGYSFRLARKFFTLFQW